MLLGVLLCALACAGTDLLVSTHPRLQAQQSPRAFWHWILPAGLTAAAWTWLVRPDPLETQLLAIAVTGALLAWLLCAEYYAVDLTARWRPAVQFALRLFGYALAAMLYLGIRSSVTTQPWALSAVAVTSTGLGIRLLADEESHLRQTRPCALGLGALLALLSRLLGQWVPSPLPYASLLAICLYVLANLAGQFIQHKMTRWVVLEYPLVGLLAAWIVLHYLR